jgi:hypothetical protein
MPRGEKGCLNFLYVELAGKYRLPAIYFQKEFDDLFRRAATYVDKILKGASPPIYQ